MCGRYEINIHRLEAINDALGMRIRTELPGVDVNMDIRPTDLVPILREAQGASVELVGGEFAV